MGQLAESHNGLLYGVSWVPILYMGRASGPSNKKASPSAMLSAGFPRLVVSGTFPFSRRLIKG